MAVTSASIKKLRADAGLTQKKLAELVGVSQAHIAKIEQGRVDPRLSTVNRILAVLRVGREGRAEDIMTKGVLFARPRESVLKASEVMVKNAVSQLPVLDRGNVVGTITEENIVRNLKTDLSNELVKNVMDPPLPVVSKETGLAVVRPLLENSAGVLITKGQEVVGIVTRSDLLKTLK